MNFDERMMQRLTNAEREIERLKVKESPRSRFTRTNIALVDNTLTDIATVSYGNRLYASWLVTVNAGVSSSVGYAMISRIWLVGLRYYTTGVGQQTTVTLLGEADAGSKTASYADVSSPALTVVFNSAYTATLQLQVDATGTGSPYPVVDVDVVNLSVVNPTVTWLV